MQPKSYWTGVAVGMIVVFLGVLAFALVSSADAQEPEPLESPLPEPQDAIVPRAWLPVAGKDAGPDFAVSLRPDRAVIDPTIPMMVEVHLLNVRGARWWEAVLDFPPSMWAQDVDYFGFWQGGLFGPFRWDNDPIQGTDLLIIGQKAWSGTSSAYDAKVALVEFHDNLPSAHEPWHTYLCASARTNSQEAERVCVEYHVMTLFGDYDGNGKVDSRDFWHHFYPAYGSFRGDANYDVLCDIVAPYGLIDDADMQAWIDGSYD